MSTGQQTKHEPADGTRDNPLCVCPYCGGALEITVRHYLRVTPEGEADEAFTEPSRNCWLYCENDCDEWGGGQNVEFESAGDIPTKAEIQEVLVDCMTGDRT